jgi:hypothetical protein
LFKPKFITSEKESLQQIVKRTGADPDQVINELRQGIKAKQINALLETKTEPTLFFLAPWKQFLTGAN